MKIGIDIRCLLEGRKTGVEEYTFNILNNIFKLDQKNEYVLFLNSWQKPKIEIPWIKNYPNVSLVTKRYPNKLLNFLIWYFNWPKLDKLIGPIDILFMPNINFGFSSKKVKTIVTIHDLSFELMPRMFSFKQSLWHFLINPKKICQKAKKIIAVSHSTKNDIVDVYKINPEKIKVIYNAVSSDFKIIDRNNPRFLEIKKKYRLPYRFILYLGAMEPRKNILAIIRAYNQMRLLKNPELEKYRLVIAGAKGWNNGNIKKEMQKSAFNKDIISIGFIEADEKPFIYNLASLFVYPSFFEGFGIPPLEAMKSGVPVVVSNNSSLPEIVGKAGLLVDPDRPDEICIAMKEIILNKELKEKLIKEGIKRAENFSWEKSAREFIDLIKN